MHEYGAQKGKPSISQTSVRRLPVSISNAFRVNNLYSTAGLKQSTGLFSELMIPIRKFTSLAILAYLGSLGAHAEETKILFVAGKKSHGFFAHEHNAGSLLLAKCLNESGLDFNASVYHDPEDPSWPKDDAVLNGVSAVVIYCDGGKRHLANDHVGTIDTLQSQGVGVGCLHYAVETIDGATSDAFLRWIGGYYQLYKSVNPHWSPKFEALPDHPVANGVEPFGINDEWYCNMRFREDMEGVTPILSAIPPLDLLPEKDHHHNSTPDGRAAVARGDPQHVMWVSENENGSRGFGFTGGHYHDNWQDDNFRKVVLNAIAWIAGREIPPNGIPSRTPTKEELLENQDYPIDESRIRDDKYADRRRK